MDQITDIIAEIRVADTEGTPFTRWLRESDLQKLRILADAYEALENRFTAPIVCMCGSTKFKQTWISENARLTGEGNIVLSVGLWGHHERKHPSPELKIRLDELHKRKVDLCDSVWVLDVGGYIGESTRSEIEYALRIGKLVQYLSHHFPDYVEPTDEVIERCEALEKERDALKNTAEFNADQLIAILETHGVTEFDNLDSVLARLCAERDRWKERSRTLPGIASAMAEQWGTP